ncbi:MAG: helix-turn-helix transcriptional regulator [Bacteroidota bacterium]
MGKYHLGEFEEIVMLTVALLGKKAYGFSIIEEIETRMNRSVSIGAMQTVLKRLEDKGYLISEFGEATTSRGGRRRRYYHLTNTGISVLEETQERRMGLWNAVQKLGFNPQ